MDLTIKLGSLTMEERLSQRIGKFSKWRELVIYRIRKHNEKSRKHGKLMNDVEGKKNGG